MPPNPDPNDLPDAEAQCRELASLLPDSRDFVLIGIHSGGAWIAERLSALLQMPPESVGSLDISFYRDDFGEKGLHAQVKPSSIPDVAGRRIVLVDDVLYTGRTTRAALNEIFDYGRPASVELAVLADRGGRELPVAAQYCVWQATPPSGALLVLDCREDGQLCWRLR